MYGMESCRWTEWKDECVQKLWNSFVMFLCSPSITLHATRQISVHLKLRWHNQLIDTHVCMVCLTSNNSTTSTPMTNGRQRWSQILTTSTSMRTTKQMCLSVMVSEVDVCVTAARTTIDVYVRADDFNLRLWCLTSTQHKGRRSLLRCVWQWQWRQ